jgi:hypothetical protein
MSIAIAKNRRLRALIVIWASRASAPRYIYRGLKRSKPQPLSIAKSKTIGAEVFDRTWASGTSAHGIDFLSVG